MGKSDAQLTSNNHGNDNDNDHGLTTGKEGLGTHVGLLRAERRSPAGRCAAGHFDSGCDCDWEHGANVTNMGMKCASDKSNILTNFHVAAPHYHPAKGAKHRPAGKVDREWHKGGRDSGDNESLQ